MDIVFTVVVAALVFGVLIFVHELGHFTAAKWAGIKVNEFALGMGPRILKKQRGETVYSIRAFPIGGFVSMEGEDEESDHDRSYMSVSPYKRLVVAVAGGAMNLIVGFIILCCLTGTNEYLGTRTIAQFKEGATSARSGLMVGDQVVKIGGVSTGIDNDIVFLLLREQSGLVDIEVVRDGERILLPNVQFHVEPGEDGMLSIDIDFYVYSIENTFWRTLEYSFKYTGSIIKIVALSLYDIIRGHFHMNQLSGPVGVATVIGESARISLSALMMLVAYITINLGFVNLLPLPALDGGRMVFMLVEIFRKRPVKWEAYVHSVGFILLMLLIIVVTFSDISKWPIFQR